MFWLYVDYIRHRAYFSTSVLMPQTSQSSTDVEQDSQGSLNVIMDPGRGGDTGGEQGSELFSVCQNQNGNYR